MLKNLQKEIDQVQVRENNLRGQLVQQEVCFKFVENDLLCGS